MDSPVRSFLAILAGGPSAAVSEMVMHFTDLVPKCVVVFLPELLCGLFSVEFVSSDGFASLLALLKAAGSFLASELVVDDIVATAEPVLTELLIVLEEEGIMCLRMRLLHKSLWLLPGR